MANLGRVVEEIQTDGEFPDGTVFGGAAIASTVFGLAMAQLKECSKSRRAESDGDDKKRDG